MRLVAPRPRYATVQHKGLLMGPSTRPVEAANGIKEKTKWLI
ncbi:MAG: hypothetical protein ACK5MJ_06615 [Alphaproteobacteria bacterium]